MLTEIIEKLSVVYGKPQISDTDEPETKLLAWKDRGVYCAISDKRLSFYYGDPHCEWWEYTIPDENKSEFIQRIIEKWLNIIRK